MFWLLPVLFTSLLVGGAAGVAVGLLTSLFIDEDTITYEVRQKEEFYNAFKAIIKSKSTRNVNLNIFGHYNNELGK